MERVNFPKFSGIRCLMMPYIQGEADSLPDEYEAYFPIISKIFFNKGDIGFLTIDESFVEAGKPQRGDRAKFGRALHTEAGLLPPLLCWGGPVWGGNAHVVLERDTQILLANSIDDTCAIWKGEEEDTSEDGDIGHLAGKYPYTSAKFMKAGELECIGILTPHESLPLTHSQNRQFLRIISSGVYGREPNFTVNPKVKHESNRRMGMENGLV